MKRDKMWNPREKKRRWSRDLAFLPKTKHDKYE